VIDATYPVGTILDRATAITDTHLNGKYKAFLAAPNQEWELVPSSTDTIVLENLLQSGETTSFCGRATLTPATDIQELTQTPQDGQFSSGLQIALILISLIALGTESILKYERIDLKIVDEKMTQFFFYFLFSNIAREHSSGTQVVLHNVIKHNDNSTGTGNLQIFAVPELKVTSSGTDSTLKYQRTA
jgi:hypothetical protein